MRLDPPHSEMLLSALEESFNPNTLAALLERRFSLRYYDLTSENKPFPNQVLAVYDHFRGHNTVEKLVAVLRDARPSVPELAILAQHIGLMLTPPKASLEALVRPGTPYQDVVDFQAGFSALQAAVCQVRSGRSLGTGTLIGDDLVLTNYHVVAGSLSDDGRLAGVSCRFDYKRAGSTAYSTPPLDVAASTALAWSPPADADMQIGGDNQAADRLDYALLRLASPVGARPVVAGGELRTAAPLSGRAHPIAISEGLLILQHPGGQPMKVDLGAVTWTGATRLRHTVNTEPGSSGAPVFDAGLQLVALHHAGHADWPDQALNYNQAIPIPLIVADIAAKGVAV